MRQETREWLSLVGKTVLFVLGGILATAALVELSVAGPTRRGLVSLAAGLALALPPLALAFRDAYREAKKGRV